MQIGIPTETVVGENRVAATPETVKKLISAGHTVVIERRAGVKAAYIDSAYEQVGAKITDDAYSGSQIILKVRAPQGSEIQKLSANTAVIAMFDPYRNTELDQFAAAQVSAFALELLPRTLSRAQNMDVLSSQANLAGYKSVLLAATEYQRMFPMLMTAAGTVKPARVVIMGVGVAGLQAIATAKRLGLPTERMIDCVRTHGNTSAASIPLALDHGVRSGQVKPGQTVLLEGVGGGFTWGAVLLKM